MNVHKAEFVKSAAAGRDFLDAKTPGIVFAGRSNVGKSSVINRLLNRKGFARVSATPGKTVQINYYRVDGAYFVDLPGYGFARVSDSERRRWGGLMEDFFSEPARVALGVQIVDSRHRPTADDETMARYFRDAGVPFVVVANKTDKLKKSEIGPNTARIREVLGITDPEDLILFSCVTGEGRDALLARIEQSV